MSRRAEDLGKNCGPYRRIQKTHSGQCRPIVQQNAVPSLEFVYLNRKARGP
jgi:hypothetical protein